MLQVTNLPSTLSVSNPYTRSLENNAASMVHPTVDVAMQSNLTGVGCLPNNSIPSACGSSKSKSKFNILDILKANKTNANNGKVFQPIGNKIVVPLSSKKPLQVSKKPEHDPNAPLHSSCFATNIKYEKPNPLFPNKTIIDMTWDVPKQDENVVKIKKERNSNSNAFPQSAGQHHNQSKGNASLCKNSKPEVFQPINHLDKLPDDITRFSCNFYDSELTCLSWLSDYKSKQINEILQKCNPDIKRDSRDDGLNEKNKIELFFTAYSKIKSSGPPQCTASYEKNPNAKPPYSFSCLIFMAIEDSEAKQLKVKDIYKWCYKHFPYFRSSCTSWKNSIRHNLSLNRCFIKARKMVTEEVKKQAKSKNYLWGIHPSYRPNLVEALKRVHFLNYGYYSEDIKAPPILKSLISCWGNSSNLLPIWKKRAAVEEFSDRDATSAAWNLMDLKAKAGTLSNGEDQAELINNTIDEIFRDTYFQYGFAQECDDVSDASSDDELFVHSDYSKEHNYCLPDASSISTDNRQRCDSLNSVKSSVDIAYEFENIVLTEDELDLGIEQDIVVGSEDEEKEVLFDSGFGSLRNFKTNALTATRETPAKNQKNNSEQSVSSRYKKTRAKSLQKRKLLQKSKMVSRKKTNPASKQKRKNASKTSKTKGVGSKINEKRKLKVPTRNTNSKYHTRSNKEKLPTFELEIKHRQRRKSRNSSSDFTNDEDEIKLAAGSLMRLAGLIRPTS